MEVIWLAGCAVIGAIGLWLVLRGRNKPEVIGGDRKPAARTAAQPARAVSTAGLSPLDLHVRKLAADGEKIEAIKAVREHTGLGLKEAKDYVEALPNVPSLATLAQAAPPPATVADNSTDVRQGAIALVAQGNSIQAIKYVRERTGMGLKESKDYVDALRVPSKQNGLHAMFTDATLEDLASSTMMRSAVERVLKKGLPEDKLVAELVRATGRSDSDMRALIARIRGGGQSPIE